MIRIIPVSHMWSLGLSTAATSSKLKVDGYRKKKEMNDIAHTSSRTPNMVRTSQSCTPSYRWFMKYTWCTIMPALKVSTWMSSIMAVYTDACATLLYKKTESELFDALYWFTCQDVSSWHKICWYQTTHSASDTWRSSSCFIFHRKSHPLFPMQG